MNRTALPAVIIFSLFLPPPAIHAQDKWFTPVNIGLHIDETGVKEQELTETDVKNIFGTDSLFTPEFSREISLEKNKWFLSHEAGYREKFKTDLWFHPDTAQDISGFVHQFSKSKTRIYIAFPYVYSRWHQYYVLLRDYLVKRDEFIDEKFSLKALEQQYSYAYNGVDHGTGVQEMEQRLGKDYDEYIGQTPQYRQIYYKKYGLQIIIQDEIVKYLEKGIPGWLGADEKKEKNYLLLIADTTNYSRYGYVNLQGDTVIPLGKYTICFTDTFKTWAAVLLRNDFIAIDRQEKILFHIFPFDNGPDYPSEEFFRITENGKTGYADMKGTVVIKPQFQCAYPFENGKAKVSYECEEKSDGEHKTWHSKNWFYINRKGERVPP